MANPFPFTAGQVLTAAQMNGIGETLTYTPTYTNFSLGNGSVTARYVRVQKLVYVAVQILCGSTTSVTGSIPTISLPVTGALANANMVFGSVWWYDDNAGRQVFGPVSGSTTTRAMFNTYNSAGTLLEIQYAGVGTPFTIAVNDGIFMSFTYEVA